MTEADDVNVAVVPEPERKQEPEVQEVPEPRITNVVEGKKKQKEAAKRLSDYSTGVASRKMEPIAEDQPPQIQSETPSAPPPEEPENSSNDLSESSMSVGNIIALAGVGVTVLCLYLSYRSDGGTLEEPKTTSNVQEETPQSVPKVVKTARAPPRNAAKPKFRRL